MPVKMLGETDSISQFVGRVYHDAPRTFIQGSPKEGEHSLVKGLLERLENIDASVPFDADIVSGDDWNFQEILDVMETNGVLVIQLSKPVFD